MEELATVPPDFDPLSLIPDLTHWDWFCQKQHVSVAWRIKLQTMLYKDANTCHQMVSMVCRFWMMAPSNGSVPHVPISSLDGFGLREDNFKLRLTFNWLTNFINN